MDAKEIIKLVGLDPTCDEVMRRDPNKQSRAERMIIVQVARDKRAMWKKKVEAAEEKKVQKRVEEEEEE